MAKLDMEKMALFHDFLIPYCNLNLYHLSNIRDKHSLAALKKIKLLSDFNPLSKGIVALPTCFDKNPF